MGNYFMGMDYGTGGCKVCIIDENEIGRAHV